MSGFSRTITVRLKADTAYLVSKALNERQYAHHEPYPSRLIASRGEFGGNCEGSRPIGSEHDPAIVAKWHTP